MVKYKFFFFKKIIYELYKYKIYRNICGNINNI